MRVLELIDGEKNYIKKIDNYIEHVKKPIEELNILPKDEKLIIFSTV